MDRYEVIGQLGDGTYGSVLKAVRKGSGEVVAIKKMKRKYTSWKECVDLREVRTLRELCHPNIVELNEVIREDDSSLCFVFEHMEANLYEVMKHHLNLLTASTSTGRTPKIIAGSLIPEQQIRSILDQVLQALSFMHGRGYFHRDIKPENLLVKNNVVKVADLGLAREIESAPPYTDYVSTRWYRAPEVLLRSPHYNSPIDLFAVGCILSELYCLQPLFPGSSEIDQVGRLFQGLGVPTTKHWPEGIRLAQNMNITLLQSNQENTQTTQEEKSSCGASTKIREDLVPHLRGRPEAMDLLNCLLAMDPSLRITADQALAHPFFKASPREDKSRQAAIVQETGRENGFAMNQQPHIVDSQEAATWHRAHGSGPKSMLAYAQDYRGADACTIYRQFDQQMRGNLIRGDFVPHGIPPQAGDSLDAVMQIPMGIHPYSHHVPSALPSRAQQFSGNRHSFECPIRLDMPPEASLHAISSTQVPLQWNSVVPRCKNSSSSIERGASEQHADGRCQERVL